MDIHIKGKDNRICVYTEDYQYVSGTSGSNNQCEWRALVEAMKYISGNCCSGDQINIYSDSVLLTRQLDGEYRIKSKNIKPIYFSWNYYKNVLSGFVILIYAYELSIQNPARGYLDEHKTNNLSNMQEKGYKRR